MNQIIAKSREEATDWASCGHKGSQRVAFWQENGQIYRAERLPGLPYAETGTGQKYMWSAKLTVAEKMAKELVKEVGRKGYVMLCPGVHLCQRADMQMAAKEAKDQRENGEKPEKYNSHPYWIHDGAGMDPVGIRDYKDLVAAYFK